MSLEVEGRVRIDGFKSIRDFGYDGRFPGAIEVNEKAIKEVFGIAGLTYNGITIKSMPQSDIYTSTGRRKKPLFRTEKVNKGWEIQVNDEDMMERLERQDLKKSHRGNFTQELNGIMKSAVWSCILEEKRLEKTQAKEFSPLALKAFEFYDLAKCYIFLRLGNGKTLVREKR